MKLVKAQSVTVMCSILIFLIIYPITSYADKQATAIFAGGCFWCMEALYDSVPGVNETISGYIGGHVKNPTYPIVTQGKSGHYEAVKVLYNPDKVTYATLLHIFWRNIDPSDATGQFCDKGPSYRSAIFYLNQKQYKSAKESKLALLKTGKFKRIATAILPAGTFYPAEPYHQNYHSNNPIRYKYYRYRCGRDKKLRAIWGKE